VAEPAGEAIFPADEPLLGAGAGDKPGGTGDRFLLNPDAWLPALLIWLSEGAWTNIKRRFCSTWNQTKHSTIVSSIVRYTSATMNFETLKPAWVEELPV